MQIRELTKSDAPTYRTLRLRALKEHPTDFSSSYEQQKDWPLARFAERLPESPNSTDSFLIGCFFEGNLVGSIGFIREEEPKSKHLGTIVGMHVAAEHQGRGYGRALVAAALERACRVPELSIIQLGVTTTNQSAISLYKSVGFETYGTEPRAIFVDGQYFDEHLMALKLDEPSHFVTP